MSTLARDTSPEAERVQIQIWRGMPTWRKLELVAAMSATVRSLAIAGLQQRYPSDSASQLSRRIAALTLGEDLATRVYGAVEDLRQ